VEKVQQRLEAGSIDRMKSGRIVGIFPEGDG